MDVLGYFEETNPPEVRQMLFAAHHFLLESLPAHASCAIKWRLPFYRLHRNFCYLNRHPGHFTLGFAYGHKLSPRPGILLDENGALKNIRYLEIYSLEALYSGQTRQILQEAIMLDEMMGKSGPGRKRKGW